MKMKGVLSVLLLAGMMGTGLGLFVKKYTFVNMKLNWNDAQDYCRKNNLDLSTIESKVEQQNFNIDTVNNCTEWCWIDFRVNLYLFNFIQWFNGSMINVTQWNSEQTPNDSLESCLISYNLWINSYCTKNLRLNFVCYTWEPEVIVVQEMMTWEEALMYCRTEYTDLVSLELETDQMIVNYHTSEVLTPSFWTSLRFLDGSWFWVNQASILPGSPSSSSIMPSCPAPPFRCGAQNNVSGVLENRDCEEKMNFICYK